MEILLLDILTCCLLFRTKTSCLIHSISTYTTSHKGCTVLAHIPSQFLTYYKRGLKVTCSSAPLYVALSFFVHLISYTWKQIIWFMKSILLSLLVLLRHVIVSIMCSFFFALSLFLFICFSSQWICLFFLVIPVNPRFALEINMTSKASLK